MGKPAYTIAEEFGVGKTQIQSLRKRKAEVLADSDNNVPGSCKRRLDAIYWLYNKCLDNVLESTVTKCFKGCGFGLDEITSENSIEYSEDIDDNIPLAAIKLTREIFGCDFSELVEIDSLETTCECEININWDKPAEELLHELKCTDNDNDSESEGENEESELDSGNIYSKSEANEVLHKLKKFAIKNSAVQMLKFLTKTEELSDIFIDNCKQTDLCDFFVPRTNILD